jgi:hypothetical protein
MADLFDTTISRYLLPMEKLEGGPSDSIYFLHKKGGFVFCEGYAHPPGGFYGSLIKYPDPDGHIDIFGRKFNWTHRYFKDGELQILPYDAQVRRQMEILPELKKRPPLPAYAENFCHFLLDECRGFFDGKNSLNKMMDSSRRLGEIVRSVVELLDVPLHRLGCTGSLAYGYYEEPLEDVDLVFYGSVVQNRRVIEHIRNLKRAEPERDVNELGKGWPLRFKHMGSVICPFFIYALPDEIPLREFHMEIIRESVSVRGVVYDDTHTAYLPVIVGLDDVSLDNRAREPIDLIVYDGAQRGEYFNGTRLHISARLVTITTGENIREALLVTRENSIKIVRAES